MMCFFAGSHDTGGLHNVLELDSGTRALNGLGRHRGWWQHRSTRDHAAVWLALQARQLALGLLVSGAQVPDTRCARDGRD